LESLILAQDERWRRA